MWQDKLQLTGFEKKTGVIDAGDALKVFDIDGLRVGVAICYDSEFPLPVRAQYEAGARLRVVPSCTDTAAGATRVRVGAAWRGRWKTACSWPSRLPPGWPRGARRWM